MTPARPPATADASLDALVAAAASRCLGGSAGTIAPDVPLSLLGLDSLSAVELAADLEATLGRPVPEDLLEECSDLRAVADRLRELPCGARPPADPFERMLTDALLPDDVRPRQPGARGRSLQEAGSILLTGATGFLGSWLARELLLTTDATLYCVVRQKGASTAPERLWTALRAARLDSALARPQVWCPSSTRPCTRKAGAASSERGSRLRVVEADISRPRLGLSGAAYDELARSVDVICHAGAAVNWVYSYEGLRSPNVIGTLELLRLACHQQPRPFHFISSLSVCYSATGERQVDEALDPLGEIRGIHLGYAQTKAVAEALVLEAGRRGLPVHIYRPGLIAGDGVTGAFNPDDLLSTLIRGCIQMGTAPDLDWTLDCQPVDWVARAVLHLSGAAGPVFHLAHTRPRHWRECALWMRLFGYPLRLVPYHAWLRQLDTATSSSAGHPLRALRDFFLQTRPGTGGLTLPQLYEGGRRVRADQARTDAALGGVRCECPPLDAALLDTYFGAFIAAGEIAPPTACFFSDWQTTGRKSATEADGAAVAPASWTWGGEAAGEVVPVGPRSVSAPRNGPVVAARGTHSPGWLPSSREGATSVTQVGPLQPLHGSGSIIGELASWRSSRPTGLFSTEVELSATERRPAIVKIKARDEDAVAVGEALAHLCDPAVGEMYSRWRDRVGLTASHVRELAIYSQRDPRFVRHAPGVFGVTSDPASGTWLVVLERIDDAVVMDTSGCGALWDDRAIAAVIDGLGALHAIWYGRERELCSREWIGHTSSAASMVEMQALWTALAGHAAPAFSSWAGPMAPIQRRLIAGIAEWWPLLERQARTLIHNDFTPRNICLRGRDEGLRLCAYDWELATPGAPLRDLVEFLCFVLPADTSGEAVEHWVAQHRRSLEQYAGVSIDPARWREAFPAALYDMLINRLGMYALIHRVRRQGFLPDVVRTWRRLYELYPLEGTR